MTRLSLTSTVALRLALAGMVGAAAITTATAQAQRQNQPARPAQPATPAPAAGAPAAGAPAANAPLVVNLKVDPSVEWTKVCGEDPGAKKTVCYTTRDFLESTSNQPILAAAIYDVQNDPKKFVRMLMPLTFMLQNGIQMRVDEGQRIPGKFQICFPNGCFAEAEVNQGIIDQLKKGKELTILAINQVGGEVSFKVPLDGFAKGFDGKPIDPKELEAQRTKLEEELKKKADEMRQQNPAATPGAPAPAAPAPAPAPAAPRQ